jgi:hypothetical protein
LEKRTQHNLALPYAEVAAAIDTVAHHGHLWIARDLRKQVAGATMRFKTRAIELEAVKNDGKTVPEFIKEHVVSNQACGSVLVKTEEGERQCNLGDYFVLTDAGQVLVRAGAIFEAIFERVT